MKSNETANTDLVRQAQLGDEESRNRLAEMGRAAAANVAVAGALVKFGAGSIGISLFPEKKYRRW